MSVFFFFKQKTAYEMRISDWSSDVCSSDLGLHRDLLAGQRGPQEAHHVAGPLVGGLERDAVPALHDHVGRRADAEREPARRRVGQRGHRLGHARRPTGERRHRSEEHTSELQSLMRISYAVFCLKKKNMKNT